MKPKLLAIATRLRHSSLAKEMAGISAANGIARILPLVVLPVIVRRIGPSSFGEVSVAMAIVGMLALIGSFGAVPYGVRELARAEESSRRRVVCQVATLRALMLGPAALVLAGIALFGELPGSVKFYVLLQAPILLLAPLELTWIFYAIGGVQKQAWVGLVGQLFAAFSSLIFVNGPEQAWAYVASFSAGATISAAVGIYLGLKAMPGLFRSSNYSWPSWSFVKGCSQLGLGSVGSQVYNKADILMLGYFVSTREVGLYAAAYKLYEAGLSLMLMTLPAFFPPMAKALGKAKEQESAAMQSSTWISTLALTGGAITIVGAPTLLHMFFGSEFAEAGLTLRLLSLAFVVGGLAAAASQAFLVLEAAPSIYMNATLTAGAVNIFGNLLLIPWSGMLAAAATTVLAQLIVASFAMMHRPSGVSLRPAWPFAEAALALLLTLGLTLVLGLSTGSRDGYFVVMKLLAISMPTALVLRRRWLALRA